MDRYYGLYPFIEMEMKGIGPDFVLKMAMPKNGKPSHAGEVLKPSGRRNLPNWTRRKSVVSKYPSGMV